MGMTAKDTANIGTPERVPLTDLNLYHKNPRVGDTQAIKGSIVANGIFRPVVVNKGTYTDKPNEILAGNHTVKAIRELAEEHPEDARWQHVDVWMVDVDSERAARIVLADNRTADLGSYDNEELLSLLDMMDGDLDGTGYDADDLEDLNQIIDSGLDEKLNDWEDGENEEENYKEQVEELHKRYNQSADRPLYEPTLDAPPELNEIVDTAKTEQLLQEIDAATNVPQDVKEMLKSTARRHTVINFQNAAEWYAHQPPEIQQLAEDQALVIVDIDKSIQNGWARLSDQLREWSNQQSGYNDADPNPQNRDPEIWGE